MTVSFMNLKKHPEQYKGMLFVLGGVIVQTRLTSEGSEVEAREVGVNKYGYHRNQDQSQGRFIGILPREKGILDPIVYEQGRQITLAGEFLEIRRGKIDEMYYDYPVFLMRQIYLFPKEEQYDPSPWYYDDPWFYPYPYLYMPYYPYHRWRHR